MGREGTLGKPLKEATEGVTFDPRSLKEGSKQLLWLPGSLDSMGRKSDPMPLAGPLRVPKLLQLRSQLQVWGGRGRPGFKRCIGSWAPAARPPRVPWGCTQQEGRG